jgi:hypothetical protein
MEFGISIKNFIPTSYNACPVVDLALKMNK